MAQGEFEVMNLRLATYNVHKFVGNDGRRDEERILRVIASMNADVLGLQEFTLADQSDNPSSVEAFAKKAGYQTIAQPILRYTGMVQFNLLLTRVPVVAHSLVGLPRNGMEPRGAIIAELDAGSTPLHVAVTHLALTPGGRFRQLSKLLELSAKNDGEPFALLADLNTMFPWEPARRLLENSFHGQKKVPTYPSRYPVFSLDAVRFKPVEKLKSLSAFVMGEAASASDHLPLVAEVALA